MNDINYDDTVNNKQFFDKLSKKGKYNIYNANENNLAAIFYYQKSQQQKKISNSISYNDKRRSCIESSFNPKKYIDKNFILPSSEYNKNPHPNQNKNKIFPQNNRLFKISLFISQLYYIYIYISY